LCFFNKNRAYSSSYSSLRDGTSENLNKFPNFFSIILQFHIPRFELPTEGEIDGIAHKSERDVMTGEETVGDVVSKFCGEEADGRPRTGIVPMMAITTHAIDSG
jgi:hypothetical protein